MEMYLKTGVVFIHFLLAAYALVTVIKMDLKVLNRYPFPMAQALVDEIKLVKQHMTWTLAGLWLTGLALVGYGMLTNPNFLANQKLWFKFFVVIVLTVNGYFIHLLSNAVRPGIVLARLPTGALAKLTLVGVVSSTSWIWACFVGTARAWNNKMAFNTILLTYIASLILAIMISVMVLRFARQVAASTQAQ